MSKYLISLTVLVLLAAVSWSQDENSSAEPEAAPETGAVVEAVPETPEADDAAADEEVDDADLDVQTYEEDEDDFVPTEEIPADVPIPFPSNI